MKNENKSKKPELKGVNILCDLNGNHIKEKTIIYEGEKTRTTLGIELLEKTTPFDLCIIGIKIETLSPADLLICNEKDIGKTIAEYDKMAGSLSKSIPAFMESILSEVDYCVSFDLNELNHGFIADELWELIRRGIPSPYYSKTKYYPLDGYPGLEVNEKQIRFGSDTVTVKHYRDNCLNTIIPINNVGKHSTNMISFTVKLNTKETINAAVRGFMKKDKKIEYYKNGNYLIMNYLFSEKKIKSVIKEYYDKTIMRGSYFPLALAVEAIHNSDFNQEKKKDMVSALKHISDNGDIQKTRKHLAKNKVYFPNFNDSLQDLVSIGCNPLCIPDEFDIEFISGLLDTCECLVYD